MVDNAAAGEVAPDGSTQLFSCAVYRCPCHGDLAIAERERDDALAKLAQAQQVALDCHKLHKAVEQERDTARAAWCEAAQMCEDARKSAATAEAELTDHNACKWRTLYEECRLWGVEQQEHAARLAAAGQAVLDEWGTVSLTAGLRRLSVALRHRAP